MNQSENNLEIEQPRVGYCRACYYDLRMSPSGKCPKCGTTFDWSNPSSYSIASSYSKFKLLLPMFLLATGAIVANVILASALVGQPGLGLPTGALTWIAIWYAYTRKAPAKFYVALLVVLMLLNVFGQIAEFKDGAMVTINFLNLCFLPYCLGILAGCALRTHLKRTNFSMKHHLPLLLLSGMAIVLYNNASPRWLC